MTFVLENVVIPENPVVLRGGTGSSLAQAAGGAVSPLLRALVRGWAVQLLRAEDEERKFRSL